MKITIDASPNDIAVIASVWAVYQASSSDDCSDSIGTTLDFVQLLASTIEGLYKMDGGKNFLLGSLAGLSEAQQLTALRLHELVHSDWGRLTHA